MLLYRRLQLLLALSLLLIASIPAQAGPRAQSAQFKLFLPMMITPSSASPFGFDVRSNASDTAIEFAKQARAKWARAGNVFWSDVEPVRGGGYHWDVLSELDENIRRLQAAGIEPTLVLLRSPAWAQSVPGRLCSPPKPEYVADFVRFAQALAARYATRVNYWEIWNEPDVAPSNTTDDTGMGCWLTANAPYYGGGFYGEVVKQVAPAIKAANPNAKVIAGALLYDWPDDTKPHGFLNGLLAAGAGPLFDALSFHAYGEWGAGDLLINKTARIREILNSYGMPNKPLIATEIAATCGSTNIVSCPPNFDTWKQHQANYAARIYAEAIALNLSGAFWYTLVSPSPGFNYSQLIDDQSGTLAPRESYYAFLNSANLLRGARYVGPPVTDVPFDQLHEVQVLKFRKPRSDYGEHGPSTIYVLWVQQVEDLGRAYQITVPPGATVVCHTRLFLETMDHFICADSNTKDDYIWLGISGFPTYVEVLD